MNTKVEGFLRHALTFAGGLLITKGYVEESELQELVGAIITLSGFIWSYVAKRKTTTTDF